MGKEYIGYAGGDWGVGPDTDWAYAMAKSFLNFALGVPPEGVHIDVAWSDYELGSYPSLAVFWDDFYPEPSKFIRCAENALNIFNKSIDWYMIKPSSFLDENDSEDSSDFP
ncbi:hypothetical protein [Acetobacter syzygii]|uniref:hypothetical protein n=1 Tax=Acetobacter syzygii TaxID=146476 RepID=UPI00156F28CE|nr:hypothetical protein [Acetobacter syzygii]NSL93047.1 hypothetical protein [Acetobacter syzygii]